MTRCPRCGSTDVVRGRYFHRSCLHAATLPCACGTGRGGLAARRVFRRAVLMKEWGPVDEDQEAVIEVVEEIGAEDEEPVRTRVFCPACVMDAGRGDWVVAEAALPDGRGGQSPFIACRGCGDERIIV